MRQQRRREKPMASAAKENEIDSLAALEERIARAAELVARLRGENQAVHEQLSAAIEARDTARQEATASAAQAQKLAQELEDLRSERKQVRTRIEKLLGQMDLL